MGALLPAPGRGQLAGFPGGHRLLCHELLEERRQNVACNCCWGYTFLLITLIKRKTFSRWQSGIAQRDRVVSILGGFFSKTRLDKVLSNLGWPCLGCSLDKRLPKDPSNLSFLVIDCKFCSPQPCGLGRLCSLLQHPAFYSSQELPLELATLCPATNSPAHFKSFRHQTSGRNTSCLWHTEITFRRETGPHKHRRRWRKGLACCDLAYQVGQNPASIPSSQAGSPHGWAQLPQAAAVGSGRGSAFPRQWLQPVFIACPGEMGLQI